MPTKIRKKGAKGKATINKNAQKQLDALEPKSKKKTAESRKKKGKR